MSNLLCYIYITVDEVALIWINGTKSIMTDIFPSTTDPRIKPGPPPESPTPGFVEHTLVIEQVTRWDSGSYTCKITSEPPVEITHTLRVIRQYLCIHLLPTVPYLLSTGLALAVV